MHQRTSLHSGNSQAMLTVVCHQRRVLVTLQPTEGTYFLGGTKAGIDRGVMARKLVLVRVITLFFLFNV